MRHLRACDTFIKSIVKQKLLQLKKIGTQENTADILTKHVKRETFDRLLKDTGYRARLQGELFVPAELRQLNTIDQLECADLLVKMHTEKTDALVKDRALSLSFANRE